MTSFQRFDPYAKITAAGVPPAKAAKVAKVEPYAKPTTAGGPPAKAAKAEPASPQRVTTYERGVGEPEPAGDPVETALIIIQRLRGYVLPPVETALIIIQRLRGYVLPAGQMPAARAIAARLRSLLAGADLDLADAVRRLIAVEDELTRLGGRFDPELAEAIEVVTRTFPGSKLVH